MKQNSIAGKIGAALSENLTPDERAELDTIVTPRAADLFVKAFGPEMATLLAPLTENDAETEHPDTGQSNTQQGEAGLRAMMRDPRYWREKDPTLVKRVENGFKTLFPENGQKR